MSEYRDDGPRSRRTPVSGATLLTASLVLAAAAGLFATVARRVATGAAERGDRAMRRRVQAHRSRALDVAVRPVTILSLPVMAVGAAAVLVWDLHRHGRRSAATAIGVAPVVAAIAGQGFTSFLYQRNPPDRDASDDEVLEPSFPSGHTTGVTAEALAIAFVLGNEGLASPASLALLVAWPVLVGVSRVYRDRHWASDILGGWAAGSGVAAGSALLYGLLDRE